MSNVEQPVIYNFVSRHIKDCKKKMFQIKCYSFICNDKNKMTKIFKIQKLKQIHKTSDG